MPMPGMVRFTTPAVPPVAKEVLAGFPEPPGLYLHVPFCTTICPFCPYNKVQYQADLAARYFEALNNEVDLYTSERPAPFGSVYIGGGTPTLCLDELAGILARLDTTGERAIEVLPNHMSEATAHRLTEMGITHVSVGAQSFDRRVLHYLQRPNTLEMNHSALDVAVGTFDCVDVDLIFDVGYQEPDVLMNDLRICFDAGVDQVSTYPLMRFGYTPFGKSSHDRTAEHKVLRAATNLAVEHGFERRSVWTFNRVDGPAYSSITREFYLGLGAGSASYSGRMFTVNHFGLEPYIDTLAAGTLPIARVANLSPLQSAAYYLFWQFYTGTADLERFHLLFGRQHALSVAVRLLAAPGWVRHSSTGVQLQPSGYDRYHDLERWVTYHLIEPLWDELMQEHKPATTPVAIGTSE
ncbi:MAG: radical SAM protein [Acidimicrobiia bacterium]|nr:radical SAM protein [Acidimicrobiia bacterium]